MTKGAIAAYTRPGCDYPAYINATQIALADGLVVRVTIRTEGGDGTASITMPLEEFKKWVEEARKI